MVNLKAKTFREIGMTSMAVSAFQHPGQRSSGSGGLMSMTKKSSSSNNDGDKKGTKSKAEDLETADVLRPSLLKSPVKSGSSSKTQSTASFSSDEEDYTDEPKDIPQAMRAVLTKNQMRRMSRIEVLNKAASRASANLPESPLKRQKTVITGRMSMFNGTGLSKLLVDDLETVHHEDFDAGVNAMALLCALLLSVPYAVVERINFSHLAWLQYSIDKCDAEHNSFGYNRIYALYRGSFLMTVYMSIGGMILATFYFLFKRTNEEDYKLWRRKARLLVTTLFFFTAFAICALILMTNMYFNYYLLSDRDNICNNSSQKYMIPGLALAAASFVWSFFLIL